MRSDRREIPHYVFFVLGLDGELFLWLEAMRFRIFAISQQRVSLIERGFYVPLLSGSPAPEWRAALAATLMRPRPLVSYRQAFASRLRRVYLWLFGTTFLAWLAKLSLLGGYERASVFGIPGDFRRAGREPFVPAGTLRRAPLSDVPRGLSAIPPLR